MHLLFVRANSFENLIVEDWNVLYFLNSYSFTPPKTIYPIYQLLQVDSVFTMH